MKRKLNEHDVPEASEASSDSDSAPTSKAQAAEKNPKSSSTSQPSNTSFANFGLDPRILRGIRDEKWSVPTPAQSQTIPLALEGKDILLRSSTGTGKTAAYQIPILEKTVRRTRTGVSTLILVPTKELAHQCAKQAQRLGAHCGIRIQNIASKESDVVQRAKLADADIVVATPARASALLQQSALSFKDLAHLVVDEGDLVLGYGFQDDLASIAKSLPKGVQLFLMSATLNTELEALQGLFAREPVILNLDDVEKGSQLVKQYSIRCNSEEKFLLVYAFYKLGLIQGKSIIFVGDIDRSYRVKLFLEQFGIKSCVLNSELPLASRSHIVEEFSKNVYDILIASDEIEVVGARQTDDSKPAKKKAKTDGKDSGVSRGIDFVNVSCVLNFDLPSSYKSYFHRIGRTARAGRSGTAISFVVPKEAYRKHAPTTFPGSENDEEVLRKIEKHQKEEQKLEDYQFDMKRLEPFRYRFADALRAVTRIAVREARIKELRSELLKSQKLSRYFEENPEILQNLRHDQTLNHPARIQQHLKHVPDYLLPGGKKVEDIGFVALNKERRDRPRNVKRKGRVVRMKSGKIDPLKTFNKKGRGKK